MAAELVQIGEFAKRTDTNHRTLRYYEELGLICPVRRSAGNFRFYAWDQAAQVAAVKRMQRLGLSLSEIRDVLVPPGNGTASVDAARNAPLDVEIELVASRLQALRAEYEDLLATRARLAEAQAAPRGERLVPRERAGVRA